MLCWSLPRSLVAVQERRRRRHQLARCRRARHSRHPLRRPDGGRGSWERAVAQSLGLHLGPTLQLEGLPAGCAMQAEVPAVGQSCAARPTASPWAAPAGAPGCGRRRPVRPQPRIRQRCPPAPATATARVAQSSLPKQAEVIQCSDEQLSIVSSAGSAARSAQLVRGALADLSLRGATAAHAGG